MEKENIIQYCTIFLYFLFIVLYFTKMEYLGMKLLSLLGVIVIILSIYSIYLEFKK